MATITIAGFAYASLENAWIAGVLTDGTYYATGEDPQFGAPPAEGRPENDRRGVAFLGMPGQGEKDFGFRRRTIWVDLVLVGSKSTVETAKAALLISLNTNTRYTIGMPDGSSRDGCKLVGDGRPTQRAVDDKVVLTVPLMFEQKSETN